ncbi:MAG: HNH endonuclease signature motif containing protein, partial [Spirochaetaceae bacterium]|nr:HNH endonuclease signature motif containing protein [Spirochaetaceae bacterium]
AGKSTREVQQMLAEVDPELAQPSDRMRALAGGRWELKAAVDAECRHGLEKLQMLLSHRDPHLTLGGLVARLVRDGLDRYDPERPRRSRRRGGDASVDGARTPSKPVRRDTETVRRNAVRAKGSDVERLNEVEPGDTSLAANRDGAPRLSVAKRHSQAESGTTMPAAPRDGGGQPVSAAKRHTEAESGSAEREGVRDGSGHPESVAKRHTEAERGSAKSAAVRNAVRRTASAPKRDEHAHVEEAQRIRGAAACGQPQSMRGRGGRAASLAKRQGRAVGDGRDAGAGGVLDRAACAAGAPFEADRGNGSWAPLRGGYYRFPTSPAKRLADAAGRGAIGTGERSPALERHLSALRCVGAVPGSRSRYIPAAVLREVWRRDQGRCSYVDRHSGRRCGSRYRLEIDHIVPFALGGGTEPPNLRVRCGAHHRLRHAQRHVYAGSEPSEARRAPVFAVDPNERGQTVGSYAAVNRAGA